MHRHALAPWTRPSRPPHPLRQSRPPRPWVRPSMRRASAPQAVLASNDCNGAGPILGLVLLCLAGTALNPDFATWDNAMNVLTRTAFIGIIAIGMCFVIIAGRHRLVRGVDGGLDRRQQ